MVKPAPTAASSTRVPFFRRPSSMALCMASGMVAPGGIAVAVNIDDHFFGRKFQPVRGRLDNAQVGLVRNHQVKVVARQAVALQRLDAESGHLPHRKFEYRRAVLVDSASFCQRFHANWDSGFRRPACRASIRPNRLLHAGNR